MGAEIRWKLDEGVDLGSRVQMSELTNYCKSYYMQLGVENTKIIEIICTVSPYASCATTQFYGECVLAMLSMQISATAANTHHEFAPGCEKNMHTNAG